MYRTIFFYITALMMSVISIEAGAQRITDSCYSTIAHIKSDGTIQNSSYQTVGHIKSDGTVQDASYRTIGHAPGISKAWVAYLFFFL